MYKKIVAIIAGTCCAFALPGYSQNVERFVKLCNDEQFVEAKTAVRGYVDKRVFSKKILPLKIIPNSELHKTVATALSKAPEHVQSKQAKENALLAWDELQRCAEELKLDLKLVSFNTKRATDPVSGILVFLTSDKGIVFAGSLDKIGVKLARDLKNGNKDEAKALLATLKMCEDAVEQTSAGDIHWLGKEDESADSLRSKYRALPKEQRREFLKELSADQMDQFIRETVQFIAKDKTPEEISKNWEQLAIVTGGRFEQWGEKLLAENRRLTREQILKLLGDPKQDFAWRVAFHGYLRVIFKNAQPKDAYEIGLTKDEVANLKKEIQKMTIEHPN